MLRINTIFSVLMFLTACQAEIPTENRDFIEDIPDVLQTLARGSGFGDGQQFCAPAAAANTLSWLAQKPEQVTPLMKQLASKAYMNTSRKDGTGATNFLYGVHKFSSETFGKYKNLELQGWRYLEPAYERYRTAEKIDLNWLAEGVGKSSAVWLNIGWYNYNSSTKKFTRIGGHWVTMVGYDFDGNKRLIIHDPAPRSGRQFKSHEIEVSELDFGTLNGDKKGLPLKAAGSLSLGKGINLKRGANVALIDSAVMLKL